jgi:[protein-PII] uridylyltransferase
MSHEAVLVPRAAENVVGALAQRTSEVETLVRDAWPELPGTALAATGGFGRRELFPYSDLDVLLIVAPDRELTAIKEPWSAFLQSLWDRGLRPSHSVHTAAECAAEHEGNLELTISLLDRRFLLGDAAIFADLEQRFKTFLARRGGAIARRLMEATEARHAKFQDTIYHLEPDLKNTPGALRDLQTVRWLGQLHPAFEPPDLSAAFETLASLRTRLHEMAGRDRNILSFDAQEMLSANPAALMRTYYRQARIIERALVRAIEAAPRENALLGRFYDWRSRLSTVEYTVHRDRVWMRNPSQLRDLGVFEFVARHQLRLASDTIDRLADAPVSARWEDWKRLLALPKPSAGLRAMQQTGVVATAIPEWRNIDCLVVRDFYHRYTVDEHTLVAIASLESLPDGRFSDLAGEIPDAHLLRFALLLHDIGKGSGQDHVAASQRIAREVLLRLGAPEEDRATVEFLIAHHLDLSAVMTSRDLYDRATAKSVAARVETIERLKQLTLLTYADISAVNPEAMTPWRLEQLWQVYLLASAELTSELYSERIHDAPADPALAQFLEGLPVRYLRTHSPAAIQAHFDLARGLESRAASIEITHDDKIHRLTLLARDQPGLFASVAGAIAAFGLSIVKAEAFSNAHGIVVDSFTFADPLRSLELNPTESERLRKTIRRVVEGKETAEQLLRSRPKPPRAAGLKPSVMLNDAASDGATLIEVVAGDRPGLLYDLAGTISAAGCNIEVVLIDTEAHKALDVFYVTAQGRKLDAVLAARLKESLLEIVA